MVIGKSIATSGTGKLPGLSQAVWLFTLSKVQDLRRCLQFDYIRTKIKKSLVPKTCK